MSDVTVKVLATVNGPYGTALTANCLAQKLGDITSVDRFDPAVFAFFSEVAPELQSEFVTELGVDRTTAEAIAAAFAILAGYPLPHMQVA